MQLRFGIITEVDAAKGLARVTFKEFDNLLSDWLPMAVPKSLHDKYSLPFDIGEHVYCIMDENCEEGVIAGAIYDEGNLPDGGHQDKLRVRFIGNLSVEYDRSSSTLSIAGTGIINIDVSGNCNIKCASSVVESSGQIELKAGSKVKVTAPTLEVSGNIEAGGNIEADGNVEGSEVKAGSIELTNHVHGGVSTGGSTTGTPQ